MEMPDKGRVLCKRYKDWDGVDQRRILVPKALKETVFQAAHGWTGGGHWGQRATYELMRKHFYFPAMESDIRMRINMCLFCLAKKKKVSLKDWIHHGYEASFPMQRIYVDLYGPLPVADEAHA